MSKNIGLLDKTIRIIMAILIGILYLTNVISGPLAIVLSIIAIVFILTSFVGFCPLYLPFGFNTSKSKKK